MSSVAFVWDGKDSEVGIYGWTFLSAASLGGSALTDNITLISLKVCGRRHVLLWLKTLGFVSADNIPAPRLQRKSLGGCCTEEEVIYSNVLERRHICFKLRRHLSGGWMAAFSAAETVLGLKPSQNRSLVVFLCLWLTWRSCCTWHLKDLPN